MNSPKLSILLPAYNAEKYIDETIQGILAQTFGDFELLIADDCSKDGTKALIDAYNDPRIHCYHNPENLGKTGTVQQLFAHAKGELVTIHDADDVSTPDRFEKQIAVFDSDPKLGMCGTSFISINEDGSEVIERVSMPQNFEQIQKDITKQSQFHGPTMMIRRFILEELKEIYRPYFKNNYEDTDLAYRIIQKYPAYNLPDFLYRYRILPNSLCRDNVDIRNRNLYKIVAFLGQERAENNGVDSVMTGNLEKIDAYYKEVTRPYDEDKTLINREAAAYYLYYKFYRKALKSAWDGVKTEPSKLVNWRTWFYCFRKTVVAKLKGK